MSVIYTDKDVVIYSDARGLFGVKEISESDSVVGIDLLPPEYIEAIPLIQNKKATAIILFERREDSVVIGVYSLIKRTWVREPQFTDVKIQGRHTLEIAVHSQRGNLNLATGEIEWSH